MQSQVGRQEWIVNNTIVDWIPNQTAIIVVDMWNVHWCPTATTRVGKIAVPMNKTLYAARDLGIHIIFAPSDVTSFYKTDPARLRTLALPTIQLPDSNKQQVPTFPLGVNTDGGCDIAAPASSPWTRQIASLSIDHDRDYLIAADLPGNPNAGTHELFNIISHLGIKNLIYMGYVVYIKLFCNMLRD